MLKLDKKIKRLDDKEKIQYEKDGYIKGLPVFSHDTCLELDNLFVLLSSKLDSSIDINQTAQ